jgi:serine/threonine-protein kinase RsbW
LQEFVLCFCREQAIAGEAAQDLNLALEELFVNAVKHGGCEGNLGVARVTAGIEGDAFRVEFADRGAPFDPAAAPPPGASLEERAAGGVGIHLARQAMGTLHYRRSGEWNIVTMRRPRKGESV